MPIDYEGDVPRLNQSLLGGLTEVGQPQYVRGNLQPGIVHIGTGAFHRAHQAWYTEQILNSGDLRWGTVGVSLRSATVRDALEPQDYLYTVATADQDRFDLAIQGGLLRIVNSPEALLQMVVDPQVQIVTLTITEKGYADESRRGVPALLAESLLKRMHKNQPLTVISCDNLSENGRALADRVMAHAQADRDSGLSSWIRDHVSFPSTMVDRITPATTAADRQRIQDAAGYLDAAPVVCERFSQWVIEDRFATDRPQWELAGAQLVSDVVPFEQVKLRVLNATHSVLAYTGLLKGYEFIHDAVADTQLRDFALQTLEHEIKPNIDVPEGLDIDDYIRGVLIRFANAAVPYKTMQVASDGSQKMSQRIFPSLNDCWDRGLSAPRLEFVVCAWIRTLAGVADDGSPISYNDPGADRIKNELAKCEGLQEQFAAAWRQLTSFDPLDEVMQTRLAECYTRLAQKGVNASLRHERFFDR
ncbi:MAG: mannitol dehydrogenase family protein [Pseudomonadota bacterium]